MFSLLPPESLVMRLDAPKSGRRFVIVRFSAAPKLRSLSPKYSRPTGERNRGGDQKKPKF